MFTRFIKDESGATAIEYGMIAGGIAVVIVLVVNGIGTNLKTIFINARENLVTADPTAN